MPVGCDATFMRLFPSAGTTSISPPSASTYLCTDGCSRPIANISGHGAATVFAFPKQDCQKAVVRNASDASVGAVHSLAHTVIIVSNPVV